MRKLLTSAVGLLLIFVLSPTLAAGQGADKVVARVMGVSITQAQLDDPDAKIAGIDFAPGEKNLTEAQKAEQRRLRLEAVIWKLLREEYYRRTGVVATQAEMNAFSKAVFKQRVARGVNRTLAEAAVKGWKFDRALYKQYGGTVIFQQSNPLEPVGAYRKFLEEHEGKRSFEILDPALRESF
ncbi:MAG TPA: hypothetical protein VNZ44_13560, partial [Pyrinomonadaceae bacterium]|nr:hypothetical protein [Pyrinomonadaceae bacterium]